QIVDRFLEERRDDGTPWMLYVGPRLPHQPFQRPREAPYQYDDVDLDAAKACKLRFTISPVSFRRFLGSCTWVDELLRRVVEEKLATYGFDSNTLVIYTTDNGAVLRRGKGSFREAGMRTPIVAWAKDLFRPTGLHSGLVGTIDIFPTILDALGIDPATGPTFPDGKSFLPLLADPSARASEDFRDVFFSNWRPDGKRAVRDDRYKLYTSLFGREEAMFDLSNDPFERVNLLLRDRLTPEADAVRASLASRLETWWCERGNAGLSCA
ncbi:MAG: sulfatase, partial [Alphaproteobacteria bacterium]